MTLITLNAGQFVTAPGFRKAYAFNTARSYAGEASHARAIANGHDTAWTVNPGSALLGDREAAKRMLAKEAEQLAGAVMIENGQVVEIEGERFKVKINGERYSDPIAFKRV